MSKNYNESKYQNRKHKKSEVFEKHTCELQINNKGERSLIYSSQWHYGQDTNIHNTIKSFNYSFKIKGLWAAYADPSPYIMPNKRVNASQCWVAAQH